MDRKTLFETKVREPKLCNLSFITGFNKQYKHLEKGIRKHWPILKRDHTLRELLPNNPSFIYLRAPGLRTNLVQNIPDPPKQGITLFDYKGFYHCGKCGPCRNTRPAPRKRSTLVFHQTHRQYPIKNFITCGTKNVTYAMECTCGYQYVGRTSRTLTKRISEHITNIRNGFPKHSVSNHFRLKQR